MYDKLFCCSSQHEVLAELPLWIVVLHDKEQHLYRLQKREINPIYKYTMHIGLYMTLISKVMHLWPSSKWRFFSRNMGELHGSHIIVITDTVAALTGEPLSDILLPELFNLDTVNLSVFPDTESSNDNLGIICQWWFRDFPHIYIRPCHYFTITHAYFVAFWLALSADHCFYVVGGRKEWRPHPKDRLEMGTTENRRPKRTKDYIDRVIGGERSQRR